MAKILLWAIESYSPHLLPYKPKVKVVVYYQLIVATFLLRTPWDTFAIPHWKLLPPLAAL